MYDENIYSRTADQENDADDFVPVNDEDMQLTVDDGAEEPVKKKKHLIQAPVIIAFCLVIAVLAGYFVFTAFFLRVPEGVTWTTELNDVPYYFEFNREDNSFKGYVGSVEIDSTYSRQKNEDGKNELTVFADVCNFYSGYPATYTVSGSRILGNQTLDFSYGDGYDYSLTQSKRKNVDMELPKDFVPDEKLLGEWVFQYYGMDIYRVTFNDDGSMKLQFVQDGLTYNGIYTIEDGQINFTYTVEDSVAAPLEYSITDDTLNMLGAPFVRAETLATADEAAQ